ncbi:hypothetical protein ElyMa_006906400 [Elysia marginata]|uniref:Uncharacterized protein n=1 Tax=Elysia marginata TaxID=1093978 RepID=A0AAV4JH43_9GAST|nr:hypothetical protein ElyMa_006906400 [Elysia marginata]
MEMTSHRCHHVKQCCTYTSKELTIRLCCGEPHHFNFLIYPTLRNMDGRSTPSGRLEIQWFENEFLPTELQEVLSNVNIEHEHETENEPLSEDELYFSEDDSSDTDEDY